MNKSSKNTRLKKDHSGIILGEIDEPSEACMIK